MRNWARGGAVLAVACLLMLSLASMSDAVSPQVAVVGGKSVYTDGEQLQMEARIVPPEPGIIWVWRGRMPGEGEDRLLSETARLVLDLTTAYHGAVVWPEGTLPDGTILRGSAQTLQVEAYCLKLELAAMPNKTQYAPGACFESHGMRVEAVLSDGSRADVTDLCRWTEAALTLQTQAVEITCTLRKQNGERGEFGCRVPVTVQEPAEQPKDEPTDVPEDEDPEENTPVFSPEGDQPEKPDEPNWSAREKYSGAVILLAAAAVVAVGGVVCLWYISRGKEEEKDGGDGKSAP